MVRNIDKYIVETSHRCSLISLTDASGIIMYANEEFCRVSGYSYDELVNGETTHSIVNSGQHDLMFWKDMWRKIARGEVFEADIINKAKDGTFYMVRTKIVPFMEDGKKFYMSHRFLINDILKENNKKQFLRTKLKELRQI